MRSKVTWFSTICCLVAEIPMIPAVIELFHRNVASSLALCVRCIELSPVPRNRSIPYACVVWRCMLIVNHPFSELGDKFFEI